MHDEPKAIRARDRMDRIIWQRKELTLAMVLAPAFLPDPVRDLSRKGSGDRPDVGPAASGICGLLP